MTVDKPDVLVLAPTGADVADVTEPLRAAGFRVQVADLTPHPPLRSGEGGKTPAVVLIAGGSADEGLDAIRRVGADTARSPLPVLWMLDEAAIPAATAGLDAGADVCLVRPAGEELLVAQVNALVRSRHLPPAEAVPDGDTEQLQKQFRRVETDAELMRGVASAFRPRSPVQIGTLTAAWDHRPTAGCGVLDLTAAGGAIRVVLVHVGGLGVVSGAAVAEAVARFLAREVQSNSPSAVLTLANLRLNELALPDAAVLSASVVVVDDSGKVTAACGGSPSPVLVPPDGSAVVWHGSGPFLNAAGGGWFDQTGDLPPGAKLVLLGGGAGADRRPDVRALAETHRGLAAEAFVAAVTAELNPDPDDRPTLLAVERSGTMAQTAEETP